MQFAKILREKRARLAEEARTLLDRAGAENRELTGEESASFDRIHAEIETLAGQIDRAERQGALDREMSASRGTVAGRADARGGESASDEALAAADAAAETRQKSAVNSAFRAFLRYGTEGLSPEERAIMAARHVNAPEQRALSAVTGSAGGYTVAPDFQNKLEEAMLAFGGMRAVSTVIGSDTGATLPMPTENDTANEGVILGENTQVAPQDMAFGVTNLGAFMYSSKIVLVPIQLIQDTAFNVDDLIARKLAERLGRVTNRHFTVGTGAGTQPNGAVTAAAIGKTGVVGQTTSLIYDDLVDLVHSVDPAYRQGAQFMFHDTTLKALKKMKDSQGRPLWLPGLAVKEPDTINGYAYSINQHMPQMAASAKSILFGDFSKYMIRDVKGVSVVRLVERYADYRQVGFLAWARADGTLLDAGTGPLKAYANSAT